MQSPLELSWAPAAPIPAQQAAAKKTTSLLERVGMLCLGLFLILAYSRAADVMGGARLHLPLIFGGIAALCALMAGRIQDTFHFWLTRLMLLFTVWFMVCIPFSYWRGGSFNVLADRWSRSFLVFFLIIALVRTLPQLRRVCLLLAASIGIAGLFAATIYGVVSPDGRLAMYQGELGNANQLAMVCLMGIPFTFAVICDSTWPKVIRGMACASILVLIVTTLRTGSRTGLLAIVLLVGVCFLLLPAFGKLVWLLVTLAGMVAAVVLLPGNVATRFLTIFQADIQPTTAAEAEIVNSSEESASSRLQVLEEGLRYTMERPIFGYGPGNFVERRNTEYQEKFGHHGYLEAHNTYVQVASEMGIPGLIIYISILIAAYKVSARVYQRLARVSSSEEIQLKFQALGLRLLVMVMALFAVFNHIAYDLYIPTILGLIIVLERIVQERKVTAAGVSLLATHRVSAKPMLAPLPSLGRTSAPPVAAPAMRPRLNGSPRRYDNLFMGRNGH